jgi:hypothetical protein
MRLPIVAVAILLALLPGGGAHDGQSTNQKDGIEPVSRSVWGALAPEPQAMVPHVIERLTVHHTATDSGLIGPALVREMQEWHMVGQGWPDLAYHVVIGHDGTVYEGRDPAFRGDTGTSYDTAGHYLVVLEGNFEVERPTSAQWDSLVAVLAWAADHYAVSPDTISGHGDHAATLCPGQHLEHRIHTGELADAVSAAMARRQVRSPMVTGTASRLSLAW